jgi:hypothetical protein
VLVTDDDLMQKVRDILLRYRGEDHVVSSEEIARVVGIREGDTRPRTRSLILRTIRRYSLPIGATTKGYFFIENEDELNRYVQSLNNRMLEMEDRKRIIVAFFAEHHGLSADDEDLP